MLLQNENLLSDDISLTFYYKTNCAELFFVWEESLRFGFAFKRWVTLKIVVIKQGLYDLPMVSKLSIHLRIILPNQARQLKKQKNIGQEIVKRMGIYEKGYLQKPMKTKNEIVNTRHVHRTTMLAHLLNTLSKHS